MKSDSRRLFFALWPAAQIRKQIEQEFKHTPQYSMNGRCVIPSNYHITLHFIGNIDGDMQQCLHLAAQSVEAKEFHLELDHYGHFYKPRVLWLGCGYIPEKLTGLHQQLGEALSTCGYQPDARVYAPHVTLMRKLTRPGDLWSMKAIKWQANEFVLVESNSTREGVRYEVIQHYPLTPVVSD